MTLLLERTAAPELRSVELEERLVVEPVLRLVRLFWSTELAERLVVAEEVLPVERLVVLLPVERLVRSF